VAGWLGVTRHYYNDFRKDETVKDSSLFGVYLAIGFLCGIIFSGWLTKNHIDKSWPLQRQGYEAVLSFDNGLTCYFDGEEVTETEWQKSMKVEADGIVGNKTLQKAVELNDIDVRRL
jgi:hypothetical protein